MHSVTDRQTDNIMMPKADHTLCNTIIASHNYIK